MVFKLKMVFRLKMEVVSLAQNNRRWKSLTMSRRLLVTQHPSFKVGCE